MKLSDRGFKRIQGYESCILHVYPDEGKKPTVGWGHLLTPEDIASGRFAHGITQAEADALYREDLARFERIVNGMGAALSQNQYDALVAFAFNTGGLPFGYDRHGVEQGVGKALRQGRLADIPTEMKRWNKVQDPETHKLVVSRGLDARRAQEAAVFMTPDEPEAAPPTA